MDKHLNFDLILVDTKDSLCNEFRKLFKKYNQVKIICDNFENVENFDCLVSPGNSFGLMDGGMNLSISNYFGWEIQNKVQDFIVENYLGEQPVGTSFIIETGHSEHPFLAHTPTLRIPMPISYTDNVYNAMWAMLLSVYHHNKTESAKIKSVVCPGLGTYTGEVPHELAAKQMFLAYSKFLSPPKSISWPYAINRQKDIGLGGNKGFLEKNKTPDSAN